MEWDEAAVRDNFSGRDVEQILSIPVLDRRIWRGTISGKFSVKSAYVIAKDVVKGNQGQLVGNAQTSGRESGL